MLTVKEINEVSFGKAGFSGYKPEDVDNFIDQVSASYQELLAERDAARKQAEEQARLNGELQAKNADSQRKLSILAQKVEAYRQEEEGIKDAILSAQRMSKEIVREAQGKAEEILKEANGEAEGIIRDARAQSEAKITEANEEARRITGEAQENSAKAVKEYAHRVEAKKAELEEVKKQVSAFRSSLLEMYKKHLECIDHIPVFHQKEERPEPVSTGRHHAPEPVMEQPPIPEPEPEPLPEPELEPEPQPEPPAPAVMFQPEPPEPVIQPAQLPLEPMPQRQPVRPVRERPNTQPMPRAERSTRPPQEAYALNDKYNYVQEQLPPSRVPTIYGDDNGLSSVGIDLNAHSNIPEALRREKDSNYSNLPFGDGVDVDGRKRKR